MRMLQWRQADPLRYVRAADAKEVGVGNPAEETYCHPNRFSVLYRLRVCQLVIRLAEIVSFSSVSAKLHQVALRSKRLQHNSYATAPIPEHPHSINNLLPLVFTPGRTLRHS